MFDFIDMDYLYRDEEVLVTHDMYEIEGRRGAFCRCGATLHIKPPFFAQWCSIECPECKNITRLYCGQLNRYIDEDVPID